MPYDETLAQRIRTLLASRAGLTERKMFGGLAFMLGGNMCCGVVRNELMVRVGPDDYPRALSEPPAREMDFTGKPLTGFVYVTERGIASDVDLRAWVNRGVAFAASLPPK